MMKYQPVRSVILREPEFKLALSAAIREVSPLTRKYLMELRLREGMEQVELWEPQERLGKVLHVQTGHRE